MKNFYRTTALLACLACGCASAEADKRTSTADAAAADQLPQPVLTAASTAVEGLEITDAKRREKRKEVIYKLRGAAPDGKTYDLTVTEAGKVVALKEQGSSKKKVKPQVAEVNNSPFQQIGAIQYPAIRESSGVVASRQHHSVLWTHNDKGNTPELYAISRDGKLLARYALNAVNNDWEDIDLDEQGRLYVGKIGNNKAQSTSPVEVLRVAEPNPAEASRARRTLPIEKTWRLRYPEKPFDSESLFVHGPHGYLISKHLDGAPASLYRFDLDGPADQTLTRLTDLPIRQPVTGANLSPDGRKLAVLTYGTLYQFEHNGDFAQLSKIEPVKTPTPPGKLEGVCFTPEGILLTAESRQIYLLDAPRTSTASTEASPAPEQ